MIEPEQAEPERVADAGRRAELESKDSGLEKKFWPAMALYVALASLVWCTMDADTVLIAGRPVELRLVPLIVLGGLALRTVLARQADRMRRGGDKGER